MNFEKMQKHPEAPDRKRGDACAKKGTVSAKEESRSLLAVTSEV